MGQLWHVELSLHLTITGRCEQARARITGLCWNSAGSRTRSKTHFELCHRLQGIDLIT